MPHMSLSRRLLLAAALLFVASALRASDAIPNEPTSGRSVTVTQPHVTAELIAESTTFQPGKPLEVALHLHMDDNWHTYWINPGDAGLATAIKWTLPMDFSGAGIMQWPTPEMHMMGPLTTYGYGGDVYLLTSLGPNGDLGENSRSRQEIKAHVTWLVCQEECIPGKADLSITLDAASPDKSGEPDPARKAFFDAIRARIPTSDVVLSAVASYEGDHLALIIQPGRPAMTVGRHPAVSMLTSPGQPLPSGAFSFFAEQPNVLNTKSVLLKPDAGSSASELRAHLPLIQNGEKPDHLSGVLVCDQPFTSAGSIIHGDPRAVQIFQFDVTGGPAASAPTSGDTPATTSAAASSSSAPTPFLLSILAAAFLGGLILNLMPCVLPVLSLKVFSLIKHAGEHSGGAWKQGLAFTAGVLISFWILAGLLIALESAGHHLGWGFQMQSPGFVLALVFLFFVLGLNLLGVFELGTSLVGLDVKATSGLGGQASSFANGALATLAATPCTAPFMGSAVGFAAQQPAAISMLVFTALALGMAAPYLALTTFPGALKLVPKPGPWMESLKQFMGFLLMGTVIFLVYVFGALTGPDTVPMLLGALLVAAVGTWIFGRWAGPVHAPAARFVAALVALVLLGSAVAEGVKLTHATAQDGWQPWSPAAVQRALAQGRPAFVDFTAAWCLSCKVNERLALDVDSTKQLFAAKHVALFRGDWTHSDPQISETLRQFNRDGVPLYLVYSPKDPASPQVLPEVLTPGLVADALHKLP